MNTIPLLKYTLCLVLFFLLATVSDAQKKNKKKKETEEKETTVEKNTIEKAVKGHEKIEGLFTFYRDTVAGDLMIEVSRSQLDREFIHFSQVADGVVAVGAFRGSYKEPGIFRIRKFYNRIEFEKVNTHFYFDKSSALSRSAGANVSPALLASEKIVAEDSSRFLIKANDLFLKETWLPIKPPKIPGHKPAAFSPGSLSSDKTKVTAIRNYPENVDLKVAYVYNNPAAPDADSKAITDARHITISVFHSLLAMPQNNYKPRFDDPRVGYFTVETNDMTTTDAINYRDMIKRWDLRKKNPEADISEPVEPITWWIENTTPVEFRASIKRGVLEWNKAFEKAGFKNALVVKEQPDTARWDAGDIRYNVLRWTSSPKPLFGGYGPSFQNPRTGQILGADIMLEFVHHTNRVRYTKLYDMDLSLAEESILSSSEPENFCFYGDMMQENTLFGQTLLQAADSSEIAIEGLREEAMIELIMHEVGHTLGLNHNMKSSQLHTPGQLADKAFLQGKSLTGSVMDYATINVTSDPSRQSHYYSTVVGPYDTWAIQYGYTPDLTDDELEMILRRSTEPELIFGNDADDMRSSERGIDPRTNTGDMSNDQISYSTDRMELVNTLFGELKTKYYTPGESYQELRQAFFILLKQHTKAAQVISRFVGGVYVDRAMQGQPNGTKPYTPVSEQEQRRAMQSISRHLFAPDAYAAAGSLYSYLAMQRRGFNFFTSPEDPKIHQLVLTAQSSVLNHLLHPNTLQRLLDSEKYGNTYRLSEVMTDLTAAIFDADANSTIHSFRQNLQVEYTKKLIQILLRDKPEKYGNITKGLVLYTLNTIAKKMNTNSGDMATVAHIAHLKLIIKNTLEEYKG